MSSTFRQRFLSRKALTSTTAILVYLSLIDFVGHMLVGGDYGYFRDELYYLVSGQHLQLGYVDFPPMIAYLGAIMYVLADDSLFAIHIIPAVVGSCLVFLSGIIAREIGGGRKAQVLSATATLGALVFLATTSIFSMDILDALWWSLCAYILIRIIRRNQPKLWLAFGLVAGLGLMTKLTITFFLFALIIGLLATPARSHLKSKWLWLGVLIASLFILPYIFWNAVNGWPTVQFYFDYGGLTGGGPIGFLVYQLLVINPVNIPLFVAGLIFYLRNPAGKPYRVLGLAYVVLYVLFTVINAKSYFLAPAYPMLFAGGALFFERSLERRRWLQPAYIATIAVVALLFVPALMPVFPPQTFVKTYSSLSPLLNGGAGQANDGPFPQYLGDRFGWNTMTATIASAYYSLPAQERSQACIFTENYGEASALILLGKNYSLPPVISGHNNFYIWGPGSCKGQMVLTVGLSLSDDQKTFYNVSQVALVTCNYCMNGENNLPVYLCTNPKVTGSIVWTDVKHFN